MAPVCSAMNVWLKEIPPCITGNTCHPSDERLRNQSPLPTAGEFVLAWASVVSAGSAQSTEIEVSAIVASPFNTRLTCSVKLRAEPTWLPPPASATTMRSALSLSVTSEFTPKRLPYALPATRTSARTLNISGLLTVSSLSISLQTRRAPESQLIRLLPSRSGLGFLFSRLAGLRDPEAPGSLQGGCQDVRSHLCQAHARRALAAPSAWDRGKDLRLVFHHAGLLLGCELQIARRLRGCPESPLPGARASSPGGPIRLGPGKRSPARLPPCRPAARV